MDRSNSLMDSQLGEPGFKSFAAVEPWTSSFTLSCSNSPRCVEEWLDIDGGRCLYLHTIAVGLDDSYRRQETRDDVQMK